MRRRNQKAVAFAGLAIATVSFFAARLHASTSPEAAASRAATGAQTPTTLGEFAVRMASALQLPGPETGFKPDTAVAALWQAGVRVKPDLKKSLTESDVVSTLSQIGLNLVTDSPERVVTLDRANAIINTFVNSDAVKKSGRTTLGAGGGGPNPNDDFNNGNGKGGKFKRKSKQSDSGTAAEPY